MEYVICGSIALLLGGAILTGVPDLRVEVPASVQDGDVVWSEWHWWGTTEQGQPFDLRAITQFTVRDGLIVRGRLFSELVEQQYRVSTHKLHLILGS